MKWNEYFCELAHVVASNSKCFSRKIGAIIVLDNIVVSTGYNGPPRGVPPCDERFGNDETLDIYARKDYINPSPIDIVGKCPRQVFGFQSGRGLHLCPATHAGANAIVSAARLGHSVAGATMYLTCGIPCKNCLGLIINAGISTVVCTSLQRYDKITKYILRNSELRIREY